MIDITCKTTRFDDRSRAMRKAAWDLVTAAANIVRNQAVRLVSTPAKRIRKKRRRDTSGGKRGSQYTIFIGSKPGQPPQVRRGHGRKHIAIEMHESRLTALLGVRKPAAYMALLEVGTPRIAPRPWLTRALRESASALRAMRLP